MSPSGAVTGTSSVFTLSNCDKPTVSLEIADKIHEGDVPSAHQGLEEEDIDYISHGTRVFR
jgi:hypothetical protein